MKHIVATSTVFLYYPIDLETEAEMNTHQTANASRFSVWRVDLEKAVYTEIVM